MSSPLPLEFLVTSSQAGLENFELGKMNETANLRKELRDVVEEWIEAEIQSRLARWILECRRTQEARVDREAPDLAPNLRESQEQPLAVPPLSTRAPHERRHLPDVECTLPPHPRLSERAEDALTFLEQHVRLQTDSIGMGVCKSTSETDRFGVSSNSAQDPVRRHRLHECSPTASLFPSALEYAAESESVRARTRCLCAGNSVKRRVPKSPAAADSASPADVAQIVHLVQRAKLRPAAPVRASMRFSPPERKAV